MKAPHAAPDGPDGPDGPDEQAQPRPAGESARAEPPQPIADATVIADTTTVQGSLIGRTIPDDGERSEQPPAREVGRYRLLEKIGEGAMASVYRAYDPSIDRPLVIKFLHSDLCRDAEHRTRFLREARAAGMLSHANIVTVFDVGVIEDRPFIAMELLDGGALDQSLTPGTPLPVREVVEIGMQVADALDYAHSKGVFHRDIKPANIVRMQDGHTYKITDFGIAHLEQSQVQERTVAGTMIGTPHYMAPEQAVGAKADARSDVYALGVVLYQLVTGARPFEADNMPALVFRITRDPPTPIEKLRTDVPVSLRRIIDRCLSKRPDARFQTAGEVREALLRVRQELQEQHARNGRRRVPLKAKLALVMAGLVGVTMVLTSLYVAQRLYETMLAQTVDQGMSLAKLIATETAAPALTEDWVGIDVLVQEVGRALSLVAFSVSDANGIVRVSSEPTAIGSPASPLQGEPLASPDPAVGVHRVTGRSGNGAFVFQVPITFQDKRVGTVRLAITEAPLVAASRESLMLLLLLVAVTALAVGIATYVLVERYSKRLVYLREAMDAFGPDTLGYRIGERPRDELGVLYAAFDRMAERLDQERHEGKN